jgi:hypothetical protein
MKQYLLAVYTLEGESMLSADELQASFAEVDRVNAEMRAAGAWVFAGGLMSSDSATVVRAEQGRPDAAATMTDGPFAETKEQLGGFWVVRCADLDEALAWAQKCSVACLGAVEVRPFQDEPDC